MYKKIIIFLLTLPIIFANCNNIPSLINNTLNEVIWPNSGLTLKSVLGVILVINIVYAAILFILSNIAKDVRMQVAAKDEIKEIIISGLIIVSFVSLIYVSCQLFSAFFGEVVDQDYFTYSLDKITSLETSARADLSSIYGLIAENAKKAKYIEVDRKFGSVPTAFSLLRMSFWGKVAICIAFTAGSILASFGSGIINLLSCITEPIALLIYTNPQAFTNTVILESIANYISGYLTSIVGQKMMLKFIMRDFIFFLLPVALLLRLIPPTRSAGNILIIVILALYIVMPFLYAVFFSAFYEDEATINEVCQDLSALSNSEFTSCNADGTLSLGKFLPLAVLFPNLVLAFVITFFSSANKIFGGVR